MGGDPFGQRKQVPGMDLGRKMAFFILVSSVHTRNVYIITTSTNDLMTRSRAILLQRVHLYDFTVHLSHYLTLYTCTRCTVHLSNVHYPVGDFMFQMRKWSIRTVA